MRTISFIIFVILVSGLTSCTVLQWRASDQEIKTHFKERGIASQISYFNIDSLDLKLRVQAVKQSKNAINLLFFHGSPSSLSAWNGYLEDTLLLKKANMYAVDRPGYGYSNFGNEITSIKMQARIISQLIQHLNLKNCIAVGASYGGPLVARLAVENSNIKGVVMISPAIDPKQEKKIWASRLTQWWLTRWLVPTAYRVAGDEKTVHAEELELLEDDWKKITIPVLHIHGNKDDLVPYGNTNYSKSKFSNVRIITTNNTGHEISWAKPELIKPHLITLINAISENK